MGKWKPPEEKPLKITRCNQTDCETGLHCFLKHQKRRKTPAGTCWACGIALVDWSRVHKRDINDVRHTVRAFKSERIRHEFWCTLELSERAKNYAKRLGRNRLPEAALNIVRSKVGKPADNFDGRRTPWEDKAHILQYAQHATATCCRKCMEVWHNIPVTQHLSDEDIAYFAALLLIYVDARMPELSKEPQHVPRAIKRTLPAARHRTTTERKSG